jgi:hypothetical protein
VLGEANASRSASVVVAPIRQPSSDARDPAQLRQPLERDQLRQVDEALGQRQRRGRCRRRSFRLRARGDVRPQFFEVVGVA